jgi:alcohol dehydrogenase (cytochrome c)
MGFRAGWLLMLVLGTCANAQDGSSVSGTYTAEQAERGRALYVAHCAACHGAALEGGAAVPLTGNTFRVTWSRPNVTVDDLQFIIATTMPLSQGGTLADAEYLDILAFILERNDVQAGAEPLRQERQYLASIRRADADAVSLSTAPAFIAGERGLTPEGRGPSGDELLRAAETGTNWLYHTRDYRGTRYSPLAQIDKKNVANLVTQCIYQLGVEAPFQTGPLVYDGTMYLTGVHATIAIDAATCRTRWRHEWQPLDREPWSRNRGVAIKDGYVVRGTADGYLLALDSADGKLLWARQVANPWLGETFTMPPMILDDRILIGPAGSENAISGWVGAFRLRDGEPIWRFDTVPGATRKGSETWQNPEGILIGGGAVWTPFSLDEERRELYVAVTNPSPDLPAFLRRGSNLYTNSIVALDVDSGRLRWYEQIVPADDHDWDLTQVSPVFSSRIDGKTRNVVAAVGKDGLLHVIDRESHARYFEAAVTTRTNAAAPVTTEGVHACPGLLGGVQWNGPALHPGANLLVVPAVDYCATFVADDSARHVEGQTYLGGQYRLDDDWQGWLTAVDARDGAVRWKYRSESPMVAAVTTTAGGLVLSGDLTGRLLALDVDSGKVLYEFQTGGPIAGGVVTYEVGRKQYIAVASGAPLPRWVKDGHVGSPTLVVFALR